MGVIGSDGNEKVGSEGKESSKDQSKDSTSDRFGYLEDFAQLQPIKEVGEQDSHWDLGNKPALDPLKGPIDVFCF